MSASKIIISITVLLLFNLILQSCSKSEFSQKVNPSVPDRTEKNKCENDEYFDENTKACLVFQCKEYVELFGNTQNIPVRDYIKGTCYYVKTITAPDSKIETRSSLNIVSRNHDGAGNITPKEIGTARFNLKLNDRRALKLVGPDKTLQSKILVDNYIFVRMNNDQSKLAYGTRDASYLTGTETTGFSDFIKYNDNDIPLVNFIDGGIAFIDPIEITSTFPVNQMSDLNIDALDCGAGQLLVDIYLLIQ